VKVFFLVPYPISHAPSQRFRFEQYFKVLSQNHIDFRVQSFLAEKNWTIFYKQGSVISKGWLLLKGFAHRFAILFQLREYDYVFIHREATPVGPPVIEWLIARVLKKKIIYDFDDAIWMTDRKEESFFLKMVKWRSKVASICKWSYKVSCGNDFLRVFAGQYNSRAIVNPTTIDTGAMHVPGNPKTDSIITIGWTGTHSTLKYLKEVQPVLEKILTKFPQVSFTVIADRAPDFKLPSMRFVQWDLPTEISDLQQFDIGIMPLPDDIWSKGKCGFKILQYMALEIPAVASPVGVNVDIITSKTNGYLCASSDEWYDAIVSLIGDSSKRKIFGKAGRQFVNQYYSTDSNVDRFLAFFE
jgi:glycosyltransferase involved in cell wall biosynthesis